MYYRKVNKIYIFLFLGSQFLRFNYYKKQKIPSKQKLGFVLKGFKKIKICSFLNANY